MYDRGRVHEDRVHEYDPKPPRGSRSPLGITAGARRKSKYIGQSGTSLHRRMRSHTGGLKSKSTKTVSVLKKHQLEAHDQAHTLNFRMEIINQSRTVLQRLVTEGCLIEAHEIEDPGILMNSKGEYGRSKLVRFTVDSNSC